MQQSTLNNLIDAEKDIIAHPTDDLAYLDSLLNSDLFTKEDIKNINQALGIIINDEKLSFTEKSNILENSWKINHKFKPPTAEEFLTEKWIGSQAKDLYPHLITRFTEYFNPTVNRNKLILYCCTGWGKSTLLSLAKYYRAVITNSYRNPKSFFKLAQSTRLTDITISFTKATAYDLVVKPMISILETNSMCERLRYERDMENPELRSSGKILFCNTSKGNSMIRIGDVYFDVASDPMDLIGRNIVSCSATELAFLSEQMTEEKVMKLLSEMITRVYNRFGPNNPNTSIVIDSSPNSMEGQVDQWIDAHKNDNDTIFVNDRKWDVQPWVTPEWEKDHTKTFPMFMGTSTKPTKVITEGERKDYDPNDIMDMPIDLLDMAKDNPSKILRDYGAHPTSGSDEKLIPNGGIIEQCFVPNLTNIYMYEYASYMLAPEGLLWNKIKNVIFNFSGFDKRYTLKRYPNAERFIGIDLAEKKDMASISMVHIECDKLGRKVYVVDFTLPILCKRDDKINIDSFKYLITDLKNLGQVKIKHVSYDKFESASSLQYLARNNFECERLSVDYSPENYVSMVSYIMQNRLKMGRNLIIKNNLKSLTLTNKGHHGKGTSGKLVVDHTQGSAFDLDKTCWETSRAGINFKDGTDSLCQAVTLADKYGKINLEYVYNYDDEKIQKTESELVMEDVFGSIENKFNLKLAN